MIALERECRGENSYRGACVTKSERRGNGQHCPMLPRLS